jgi:hypothetical protein
MNTSAHGGEDTLLLLAACADALVLNSHRFTCATGCRLGVLHVHRFACKGGLLSQEITDCLAAPPRPPAAPVDASEPQVPTSTPAPESSTCFPASSDVISDGAPTQGTIATAVRTEPIDRIEGEHADGVQAQTQPAMFAEPVAAKPVTWFVPACS